MLKSNVYKIKINRLIHVSLTVLAALSLVLFIFRLNNIKENNYTAVFGIDFIAYHTAAELVKNGNSTEIYAPVNKNFSSVDKGVFFETAKRSGFKFSPTRYVYMPVFLLPFKGLSGLKFQCAADIWLGVNILAIAAIMLIQWYLTRDILKPFPAAAFILSINLLSFPLFYALKLGQTTIIIYLAVSLIYLLTMKQKPVLAGTVLGVITAMKYSPVIFLLYFLYRKQYKLVFSCIVSILSIIMLSVCIYGWELNTTYWSYLSLLSGTGQIAGWSNQSLQAFMLRQFTNTNALHFNPVHTPALFSVFKYLLSFLVLLPVYLALTKNNIESNQRHYPLEFSAILLSMLILSPVTWLHYLCLSSLSFILLIMASCRLNNINQTKKLIITSVLAYSMVILTPDFHRLMAVFGQSFIPKFFISLPLGGIFLLLMVNLRILKINRSGL